MYVYIYIYINFQLFVVILLEMANFDPPFDPMGLGNGVRMGNHYGYKVILKKNPYFYQKLLRN